MIVSSDLRTEPDSGAAAALAGLLFAPDPEDPDVSPDNDLEAA